MAELVLTAHEVAVRLSRWERVGAMRGDVVVARTAVVGARAVAEPWREIRGFRAPGYRLPGHAAVGTWRHDGVKDFVAVRYGRPGLVVDLSGCPFARLVLSLDGAGSVAAMLRPGAS